MQPWVLLPGTLCTSACFDPILAALAARGISPPTSTFVAGDSPDPLSDARSMLRAAPQRFVICAFSLGGMIAFQAALAAPERVVAMILISVTGRADRAENADARRAQVEQARRVSCASVVRDTLWPGYVAAPSLHDRALRSSVETMAAQTDIDRYAGQSEIAIVRPNVLGTLGSLRMPTLVISGEADVATPPERGAEVAQALVEAHHHTVADAGHFVLMEQPGKTADEIAAWMASTDGAMSCSSKTPQGDALP